MLCRTILLIGAAFAASAQSNVSDLAAGVLDQTRQARQAIAAHDSAAAAAHVRNAQATVNLIQQQSPNAPAPLMVPIYSSVETTTTVAPVRRHHFNKNSSIRGVEGTATAEQFNVSFAGERLPVALAALDAGDWQSADAALAAIQNNVSVVQTNGDMPLAMARRNLELARQEVAAGRYHEAVMPLRSAAQALGEYERGFSGQTASDIEGARLAMLDRADHIRRDRADAGGQIDNWLAMVRQWSNTTGE